MNERLLQSLALLMKEWNRYTECLMAIGFSKEQAEKNTHEAMTIWCNQQTKEKQ